jgi:hypothetical protein
MEGMPKKKSPGEIARALVGGAAMSMAAAGEVAADETPEAADLVKPTEIILNQSAPAPELRTPTGQRIELRIPEPTVRQNVFEVTPTRAPLQSGPVRAELSSEPVKANLAPEYTSNAVEPLPEKATIAPPPIRNEVAPPPVRNEIAPPPVRKPLNEDFKL